MPRLEAPIAEDGPIVDIRCWVSPEYENAVRSRALPRPKPFSTRGLIDTGARATAIQLSLVQGMGLPIHDWMTITSSASGNEVREVPVYQLRMTFGSLEAEDAPKWRIIRAAGVRVVSSGALILIGQDLLATRRFTYDGRKRRMMMSY